MSHVQEDGEYLGNRLRMGRSKNKSRTVSSSEGISIFAKLSIGNNIYSSRGVDANLWVLRFCVGSFKDERSS